MRILLKLSSLSAVLLLTACNPVSLSVSNHRMENPEVNSKPFKVNLASGFSGRTDMAIEERIDSDSDGVSLPAFAQGGITLGKGVEVSIRVDADSAKHLGVKYQFYGDHAEQSSSGNFSQAVTLGYEMNHTRDDSDCGTYDCNYDSWEHDTDIYDGAWIFGYKLTERNIIYGGPFYQWGSLEGYKYLFDDSQEAIDSDGDMIGANIALEHRFSSGLGLTGEVVYSTLRWEGFTEDTVLVNFKMDYQF